MKDVFDYHGTLIEYEYEGAQPGERPSVVEWRKKEAKSRALQAMQDGPSPTGPVTDGAIAHKRALQKVFGRHLPRVSSFSELLAAAQKDREHRRSGG